MAVRRHCSEFHRVSYRLRQYRRQISAELPINVMILYSETSRCAKLPRPCAGGSGTFLAAALLDQLTMPAQTKRSMPPEREADRPQPYVLNLGDGRKLLVELPASSVAFGPEGELLLRPSAVRLLDRLRVGAADMPENPSPGWIKTFRTTLGLTQRELGEEIGVDKLTVSRWERGQVQPRTAAVREMRKLRAKRARKGLVVA